MSEAIAVARAVLARLTEPEELAACRLPSPTDPTDLAPRWEPGHLYRGDPGLALAFGHLHRHEPDAGWDRVAHRFAVRAARSLEAGRTAGIGMLDGLAGVAFALRSLSEGGRRYRGALAAVEAALRARVARRLERLPTGGGEPFAAYDVVSGLTGAGRCLLDVPEGEGLLRGVLARLIGWATAGGFRDGEGVLNLGLAHGIPGPLALLGLARRRGVVVPGDAEAAACLAGVLTESVADCGQGPDVPAWQPSSQQGPTRVAWCYGNVGVARALQLAGSAFAEPAWTARALVLLRAALARPPEVSGLLSPTLCHGLAGVLQAVTRIDLDLGEGAGLGPARAELTRRLLDAHEPGARFGYRDREPGAPPVDDPGFLNGAAGVALALLPTGEGRGLDWDGALLLA